jgi:hypothetical protein
MKFIFDHIKEGLNDAINLHKLFEDYPELEKIEIEAFSQSDDGDRITIIESLTINGIKFKLEGLLEIPDEQVDELPEWLTDQGAEDMINLMYSIAVTSDDGGDLSDIIEFTREEVSKYYNVIEMCSTLRAAIDNL